MITRSTLIGLILLFSVVGYGVASAAEEPLLVSDTPSDNAYLFGSDVRVATSVPKDVAALAGTLVIAAPIGGDGLLGGGNIDVRESIGGDLRAIGGRLFIEKDVAGDLIAAAGSITVSGKATDVRIAGGNVTLTGGAGGSVIIYGANVTLSGEYAENVTVVASDRFALGEGAIIHGVLKYNAPQEAVIPVSATVDGGVTYTGSSSFLPTTEEAETFALAGLGVFFLVRLVSAAVAAGLIAGLFPGFTQRIVDRTLTKSAGKFALLALIGFAVMIATPVLVFLLMISFAGIGIGLVVGAAYVLIMLLAYLYAGVLAGSAIMTGIFKRARVTWKHAVLGMLVLRLVGVIPGIGFLLSVVLTAAALGALVITCYKFAFARGVDPLSE